MSPKKVNHTIFLITTLLISLICFALHAYHAQVHCFTQAGDNMTSQCGDGVHENCIAGYAISASQSHSGVDMKFSITCPFSTFPTIFGLLGFVLTIILLIFFSSTKRSKASGTSIAAFGSLIIGLLSSSLLLMIGDVMKGAELAKDADAIKFFSPASYLTHIVLAFIGIVLVSFLTLYGYQSNRFIDASGGKMISNPQIHQENELSDLSESTAVGFNVASLSKNGFAIFD